MSDLIPEIELAQSIGVSIEFMRARRGQRGQDWHRQSGGIVAWSKEAADKLTAQMGVSAQKAAPRNIVVVTRIQSGRLLCADDTGAVIVVRVPGNTASLFLPKMRIKVAAEPYMTFRYLGPEDHEDHKPARFPRRPGIW